MTQENAKITDGEPIELDKGPSVMDMALSLFGDKIVVFKSSHRTFYVEVSSLRLVSKKDTEWSIEGSFRIDPNQQGRYGRCHIEFWVGLRKGLLIERTIDVGKKFSAEYLNTLSDDELRKEIVRWREVAKRSKGGIQEYLAGLETHDRLVFEARLSQILGTACTFTKFDHLTLQYSRLRKAADASEDLCHR
jgi:hypothetical protein